MTFYMNTIYVLPKGGRGSFRSLINVCPSQLVVLRINCEHFKTYQALALKLTTFKISTTPSHWLLQGKFLSMAMFTFNLVEWVYIGGELRFLFRPIHRNWAILVCNRLILFQFFRPHLLNTWHVWFSNFFLSFFNTTK